MAGNTFYAGPGKVFLGTTGFQPDGVNGAINMNIEEKTALRGTAMFGELFETLDDVTAKVTLVPFDNWLLLPKLFPAFLGVDTSAIAGGAAAALKIGTDVFDPTLAGTKTPMGVYTEDGRLYNFVRGGMSKHPNMKFLPGVPLFSQIELSAFGDVTLAPGQNSFLMTNNAITESGGVDPDATGFGIADYGQSHWTGSWGNITGFVNLEAEDGWELVSDVKYNSYTVQKVSKTMRLASSRFMIKGRLVNNTVAGLHSLMVGKVLSHVGGAILSESALANNSGAQNFVLTGANGKTVTLVNVEMKSTPFEFGGTKLNTGEVGFVTKVNVAASVPTNSLIFSA